MNRTVLSILITSLMAANFDFFLTLMPTLSWLSRTSLYGLYPYKSSMIGMENLGDPSGDWDIVETIGKGTYGKVYRVTNKKDGSQAAVKVLDPVNVSQHDTQQSSSTGFLLSFLVKVMDSSVAVFSTGDQCVP